MKRILTSALAGLLLATSAASAATPNPSTSTPSPEAAAPRRVELVKPSPEARKRARVRAYLANRRDLNALRLTAYSRKGVFPKNRVRPGRLNVFIDSDGAICAAANLMFQDGLQVLVRKTARRDNYLRLAAVERGPLYDWILTSGLTQAEVDDIQEPYSFINEPRPEPRRKRIAGEVQRLRKHFAAVQERLKKNRRASLDAATDLVMARPDLVARIAPSRAH